MWRNWLNAREAIWQWANRSCTAILIYRTPGWSFLHITFSLTSYSLQGSGGRAFPGSEDWEVGLTEIGMLHGFSCSEPWLVVISQQLIQEIQGLWADKVLVFTVDKALPSLTRVSVRPNEGMKNGPQKQIITTRHSYTIFRSPVNIKGS